MGFFPFYWHYFLGCLESCVFFCPRYKFWLHTWIWIWAFISEKLNHIIFLICQMFLLVLFCKGIEKHCGGFAMPQLPHFDWNTNILSSSSSIKWEGHVFNKTEPEQTFFSPVILLAISFLWDSRAQVYLASKGHVLNGPRLFSGSGEVFCGWLTLSLPFRGLPREDDPIDNSVLQCRGWWAEGILLPSLWVFCKKVCTFYLSVVCSWLGSHVLLF